MLVEDVMKKLIGDGVIRLAFQNAVNLFQDSDMFQRSLPKQDLALLNVGLGKCNPLGRDLHVALFESREAQQDAGFKNRQQVFDVHDQFFGEAEEIFAASAIAEQFRQAGDTTHARMRQQLVSSGTNG